MTKTRAWVDWVVLALCMVAALAAALYGADALDASAFTHSGHGRAPFAAFVLIAGLAVVNCSFLVGVALCKARADLRLGRR
jgi:hypothetical protein